jgi:superfamily II helicase
MSFCDYMADSGQKSYGRNIAQVWLESRRIDFIREHINDKKLLRLIEFMAPFTNPRFNADAPNAARVGYARAFRLTQRYREMLPSPPF